MRFGAKHAVESLAADMHRAQQLRKQAVDGNCTCKSPARSPSMALYNTHAHVAWQGALVQGILQDPSNS